MTLIIFKYALPALLGYILFVGISGHFQPLRKPLQRVERPAWFLGIWTGIAIALVTTLSLHVAYSIALDELKGLLQPTALLLAGLLLPGLIGYFIYRRAIHKDLNQQMLATMTCALDTGVPTPDPTLAPPSGLAQSDSHESDGGKPDTHVPENDQLNTDDLDLSTERTIHLPADSAESAGEPDTHDSKSTDSATLEFSDTAEILDGDSTNVTADASQPIYFDSLELRSLNEPATSGETRNGTTPQAPPLMRGHSGADAEEKLNDTFAEIAALRQTLTEEMTLRTEAETNLRAIRKSLSELETESRNHESSKATALIGLEEELENRIREIAAAEARASRHEAEQVAVETQVLNLKQDLLQAKREVRRSTAARAKALGTANKAVAFARQSVQARARAEAKLREAEDSLANRQETISSLINALEKEKRRTEEEVSAIARQMTINEKQHYARRSLEEVARSVEGKLSTRLVKKIAKARPLANDS